MHHSSVPIYPAVYFMPENSWKLETFPFLK